MDYDPSKYKIKNWKSFTSLHWILNPGLAFNQIVLGQRIPKKMLIDKTSDKPLMERTYVPCPHCETMHDGRTWSGENNAAFKNWFGYYCPNCGEIIPCLHNGLAYLLLIITFPLWGWFKDDLKQRWLEHQANKFDGRSPKLKHYNDVSWTKIGAQWGGGMFLLFCGISLVIDPSNYLYTITTNLIIWGAAGFAFGAGMKYWLGMERQSS